MGKVLDRHSLYSRSSCQALKTIKINSETKQVARLNQRRSRYFSQRFGYCSIDHRDGLARDPSSSNVPRLPKLESPKHNRRFWNHRRIHSVSLTSTLTKSYGYTYTITETLFSIGIQKIRLQAPNPKSSEIHTVSFGILYRATATVEGRNHRQVLLTTS